MLSVGIQKIRISAQAITVSSEVCEGHTGHNISLTLYRSSTQGVPGCSQKLSEILEGILFVWNDSIFRMTQPQESYRLSDHTAVDSRRSIRVFANIMSCQL